MFKRTTSYEPCPVCSGNAEHCDCDDMTVHRQRKLASIVTPLLILMVVTPSIAQVNYAADVTGTQATPAAKVAPKTKCPLPKGAPARGVAAARRECAARSKPRPQIFTLTRPESPTHGSGTR